MNDEALDLPGLVAFDQMGAALRSTARVMGEFARALEEEGWDGDDARSLAVEWWRVELLYDDCTCDEE